MQIRGAKTPTRKRDQLISRTSPYRPLKYANETKNPPGKFIRYTWLTDDFYVYLIAYATTVSTWLQLPTYLALVITSSLAIWTVYEIGYCENDTCGYLYEDDPQLPRNYGRNLLKVSEPLAIIWAIGFSIAASIAAWLASDEINIVTSGALFIASLTAIRAIFWVFNRIPKSARPTLHLALQFGKFFSIAALATLSWIGLALLVAQVSFRWLPYVYYRWVKPIFPEPITKTRALLFFIGLALVTLLNDIEWTTIEIVQASLAGIFVVKRAVNISIKQLIGS